MDRVRFGRALGFGARQAAKTLVQAMDAATSENPSAKSAGVAAGGRSDSAGVRTGGSGAGRDVNRVSIPAAENVKQDTAAKKAAHHAATAVTQTRGMKERVKRGGRRFGEAMWGPFVRLSGVLWLEVSGVFFGLFALAALGYLWKYREAWHATATNTVAHRSLLGAVAMMALFGYFCISNFVRARRRERAGR